MTLAVGGDEQARNGDVARRVVLDLALQTRRYVVGAPRVHQLGTERAGHHDAVTLLPRRAVRAHNGAIVEHAGHCGRHKAAHHVSVAREPTSVQDDAQTRLDALLLAAICHDDTFHLAIGIGEQTRDLGVEHELRTLLFGLLAQRLGETGADAIGVLVHAGHGGRHIGVVVHHGALGRQALSGKSRALLG